MVLIPDDPYIRDAEINGTGYDAMEPKCPVCYAECDILYIKDRDVIGCPKCVCSVDACDWLIDHMVGDGE